MSRIDPDDKWIYVLDQSRLIEELKLRRLSTDGGHPILLARLLRHVRRARSNVSGAMGGDKDTARGQLNAPADDNRPNVLV